MAKRAVIDRLGECTVALRRYAFALTRSREEAEDLVQETLTRAIVGAGTFRDGGNLRRWLFAIMHNAFISGCRSRPPDAEPLPDDLPDAQCAPSQIAHLEAQDVLAALGRLPEAQRAALVLIALEEFSYADAARILGVPPGTLMSRLARAREALRRAMDGETRAPLRVIGGAR